MKKSAEDEKKMKSEIKKMAKAGQHVYYTNNVECC